MKTGMPDGTFSLVHGRSTSVGLAIVRHPRIMAIGFTGSFRGGKAIYDEACRRALPIPVYAEMGSTNPVFVLPWAAKMKNETIAADLAASVTQGVGQFCTNPGLVFVQQSEEGTTFKQLLAKHMSAAPSGVMLSSAIQSNFESGLQKIKDVNGVTVHPAGKRARIRYVA
jgi:NADP-dependent aldehyde dehydrogenase